MEPGSPDSLFGGSDTGYDLFGDSDVGGLTGEGNNQLNEAIAYGPTMENRSGQLIANDSDQLQTLGSQHTAMTYMAISGLHFDYSSIVDHSTTSFAIPPLRNLRSRSRQRGPAIRLLKLKPSRGNSAPHLVEGTLEVVGLDGGHPYEALSYTWGDGALCREVRINGKVIPITRNLYEFLLAIRPTSLSCRTVWVDAICISRLDAEEKSQQVSIIGSIFKTADRVLIWLGEHADGSERLFRRSRWSIDRVPASTCHSFLNREYWTRTWIVQEIALAASVLIHCGADHGAWSDLEPLLDPQKNFVWMRDMRGLNRWRDDHDRVRALFHYEARFGLDGHRNYSDGWPVMRKLYDHVREFRDMKCRDPRDKIYALLSLFGPDLPIAPDYTLSAVELFIRVCVGGLLGGEMLSLARILELTDLKSCHDIVNYAVYKDLLTDKERKEYSRSLLSFTETLLAKIKTSTGPESL